MGVLLVVLAGAVLAAGQILLVDVTGLTQLGTALEAGAERMQGVQNAVVVWCIALSAPVAVWLTRKTGRPWLRALAAAAGTLAAWPVVHARTVDFQQPHAARIAITGAVLGLAAALVVAWRPRLGAGVAAHAAALLLYGLAARLVTGEVAFYPGLVQPRTEAFDRLRAPLRSVPLLSDHAYFLPEMALGILLVLAVSVALAIWARRSGTGRLLSTGIAVAGPVLAAATYEVAPFARSLWGEDGAVISVLVMVLALIAGALTATRARPAL